MRSAITLLFLLFLCSCTKGQGISLIPYENKAASPQSFELCHGFGCMYRTDVSLTDRQWQKAKAVFSAPAINAEDERRKITKAIAVIEKEVLLATGMESDEAESSSFPGEKHQMDCIDETINTSMYLKFLQKEGFLKFHEVADPVHRGYLIDGVASHNSAAVREISTGGVYAIDSYFEEAGKRGYAVPLDIWLDSWEPNRN